LMLVTHDNDLTQQAGRVIRLKGGRLLSDEAREVSTSAMQ